MSRLPLAVLLLVAGCAAYDPPVVGDRAAVKYRADVARCRTEASKTASRKANATPQTAFAAVFDSGDAERRDVVSCMQVRGYSLKPG